MKPTPELLFSESQIDSRIQELGPEVAKAFAGNEIAVIGLMKGCVVFMADLIRSIPLETTCHFLRVAAHRDQGMGSMRTDIVYSTEIPYEGRDILLLDSIVDTGITLNFLLDHIREHKPKSLKVCALIDKPGDRKIDVNPDFAAFTLREPLDGFIVGYGLDHLENYRGLPYLGTIPRPEVPAEARKPPLSPGS